MALQANILIAVLVAGGALGLLLLVLGLRGRRVNDHPHCRRCRFDLFALGDGTRVCPECGSDCSQPRAVRIGTRHRRPGIAAVGAVIVLLVVTTGATMAWGRLAGFDWNTVKPVWLLVHEAGHDDASIRQAALDELFKRQRAGGLSRAAELQVYGVLLDLQANPAIPWDDAWGRYLFDAGVAGHIDRVSFERFLENAAVFTLDMRSPARTGSEQMVWLRFESRGPDYTGLRTRVVRTSFQIGDTEYVRRSAGFGEMAFPGSGGSANTITLTNPPGTYPVTARWQMTVIDGDSELHTWTVVRTATIEITDESGDPITRIAATDLIDEIRAGITVHGVRIHAPDSRGRRYVESTVNLKSLPVNVAFDVYWRINDREWRVGQAAVAAHQTHGFGQHMRIDDLPADVNDVTIVLRASEDAARRTTDLTEIWDGEIVIDKIPVEQRGMPTAQ